MVVVGDDTDAFIVDLRTCKHVHRLQGHLDYSFAASWHPFDGHTLATGNQVSPVIDAFNEVLRSLKSTGTLVVAIMWPLVNRCILLMIYICIQVYVPSKGADMIVTLHISGNALMLDARATIESSAMSVHWYQQVVLIF